MQNGMCGVGVRPPAFGKGLAKLHESDIKKRQYSDNSSSEDK
ncbi:MAG: hypothetical protein QXY52_01055 [Conexivisphaerales archaeon]